MRGKYSIFLPIAAILSGIVLELNSLGLIGNYLPKNILMNVWPAILIFVGLDLLFTQHRLIGSLVVLFTGAAVLSTQFLEGGTNNEIWQFFLKVWPILLVLFGIDWIFAGRSLINTAVIIAVVIIIVYVLFAVLDVPIIKKLPFELDLKSIIPTSTVNGVMPGQAGPQPWNNNNNPMMPAAPVSQPAPETVQPIVIAPDGQLTIAAPAQQEAVLNLNAASGKISLKNGGNMPQFVSGSIRLDPAENIAQNAELSGPSAQYTLQSSGNAAASDRSNWDLALSSNRTAAVNAVLNSGYIKADLRSMNLSSVSIENKFGPIDVMVPRSTNAPIRIKASDGDIRVYIPGGTGINCYISGTGSVDFPQYSYNWSGNMLSPRRPMQNIINVEITSNSGRVQIIESE